MPRNTLPPTHHWPVSERVTGWLFAGAWSDQDSALIEHCLTERVMKGARPIEDTWVFTAAPDTGDQMVFSAWQPDDAVPQTGYVAATAADLADDLWEYYFDQSLDPAFQQRLQALMRDTPPSSPVKPILGIQAAVPPDVVDPSEASNRQQALPGKGNCARNIQFPDPKEFFEQERAVMRRRDHARRLLDEGDALAARAELTPALDVSGSVLDAVATWELYGDTCMALHDYPAAQSAYHRGISATGGVAPGPVEQVRREGAFFSLSLSSRVKLAHVTRLLNDLDQAAARVQEVVYVCETLMVDSGWSAWYVPLFGEALVIAVDVLFRQGQPIPALQTAERAQSLLMQRGRSFHDARVSNLAYLAITLYRHGAAKEAQSLGVKTRGLADKFVAVQDTQITDILMQLDYIIATKPQTGNPQRRTQAMQPLDQAALTATLQITDDTDQADVVRNLIPLLDAAGRAALLDALNDSQHPHTVAWGLATLATREGVQIAPELFTAAWSALIRTARVAAQQHDFLWEDQWPTLEALLAIRPFLAERYVEEIDAQVRSFATPYLERSARFDLHEALIVVELIPHMRREEQASVRSAMLESIEHDISQQGMWLLGDPDQMPVLIQHLAELKLARAVEAVLVDLPDEKWSPAVVWLGVALLQHGFAHHLVSQIFQINERSHYHYEWPHDRCGVRVALLPYLDPYVRSSIAEQTLTKVAMLQEQGMNAGWMARWLCAVVPYLDPERTADVVVYGRRLPQKRERLATILAVLPHAEAPQLAALLLEARELARSMKKGAPRAEALLALLQAQARMEER